MAVETVQRSGIPKLPVAIRYFVLFLKVFIHNIYIFTGEYFSSSEMSVRLESYLHSMLTSPFEYVHSMPL